MASVSGLSAKNRVRARDRVVQAAMLGYKNKAQVRYTQGGARWSGINGKKKSRSGQFPRYADCSSYATWCIWNGIFVSFKCRDTVNGASWKAGYTGTMLSHGKPVRKLANVLRGDCVIYGRPGSKGAHTAIVVGKKNGVPMVISHGSDSGPHYLPYNYRSDVMQIRRYI